MLGRLEGVSDLFVSDAVYHVSCRARFSQGLKHTQLKRKSGRSVRDAALSAFERLCYQLEAAIDNELYTLDMLHKCVKLLTLKKIVWLTVRNICESC